MLSQALICFHTRFRKQVVTENKITIHMQWLHAYVNVHTDSLTHDGLVICPYSRSLVNKDLRVLSVIWSDIYEFSSSIELFDFTFIYLYLYTHMNRMYVDF